MRGAGPQVPEGPLAQAVLALSQELGLCICVGIAELDMSDLQIYNSQVRRALPLGASPIWDGCVGSAERIHRTSRLSLRCIVPRASS